MQYRRTDLCLRSQWFSSPSLGFRQAHLSVAAQIPGATPRKVESKGRGDHGGLGMVRDGLPSQPAASIEGEAWFQIQRQNPSMDKGILGWLV